jgi:hypothetical protein
MTPSDVRNQLKTLEIEGWASLEECLASLGGDCEPWFDLLVAFIQDREAQAYERGLKEMSEAVKKFNSPTLEPDVPGYPDSAADNPDYNPELEIFVDTTLTNLMEGRE